jgi:hypothetical protein
LLRLLSQAGDGRFHCSRVSCDVQGVQSQFFGFSRGGQHFLKKYQPIVCLLTLVTKVLSADDPNKLFCFNYSRGQQLYDLLADAFDSNWPEDRSRRRHQESEAVQHHQSVIR